MAKHRAPATAKILLCVRRLIYAIPVYSKPTFCDQLYPYTKSGLNLCFSLSPDGLDQSSTESPTLPTPLSEHTLLFKLTAPQPDTIAQKLMHCSKDAPLIVMISAATNSAVAVSPSHSITKVEFVTGSV